MITKRKLALRALRRRNKELLAERDLLRYTVRKLQDEVESLRQETLRDPLTGLRNRVGLRSAWADHCQNLTAVIIIDIDHFKMVNDRHGHAVGDIALCYVAEAIRTTGIIGARTGGDEFIGLVTTDPMEATERLMREISKPIRTHGLEISITASIGMSRIGSGVGTTKMISYLEMADHALYQGKRNGRNQIHEHGQEETKCQH